MSVHDHVPEFGRTLGEELLEPTRIYMQAITSLRRDFQIYGISHITGGGLVENLPRILPGQCKAVIHPGGWIRPPVFEILEKEGRLSQWEMMRTFNNGVGLVIVVSESDADEVLARLKGMGETAYHVGTVEPRGEKEAPVELAG
jgi:phosphoribosylformylglycinamidine cyclo-ligase